MSEADDVHVEDAARLAQQALRRLTEAEDRIAELEATVEDLQADDSTTSATGFGDWRDQAVLDRLEPGQRVSAGRLKKLYRAHGEVTNETTQRTRLKSLVEAGPFEMVAHATWQYTGGEDGE